MSLKEAVLGSPFVYNVVRPFVVGGIDMGQVLSPLGVEPEDTVVDVGCGTGVALEHLPTFARYVGFDTDERALEAARKRAASRHQERPNETIEFRSTILGRAEVAALEPHRVILSGLLHHLDDATNEALMSSLLASRLLKRVVTVDITFVPGKFFNNLLTILDRGQHPRDPGGYVRLAERAGLCVEQGKMIPSSAGSSRVEYWWMQLGRGGTSVPGD